jgi:hypothetical protein
VSESRDGNAVVFTRAWSAHAPLARVVEATRLERTPELHPLITRVEALEERGDESECWLHERVPVGPWSVPNRYWAGRRVVRAGSGETTLVLEARARFGVRLEHALALREAGRRTEVTHRVRVEAPRWLRRFVAATAARAHGAWMERVVAWAEREPRSP